MSHCDMRDFPPRLAGDENFHFALRGSPCYFWWWRSSPRSLSIPTISPSSSPSHILCPEPSQKGKRVASEKMFRGSLLKALPQGFFNWPVADGATKGESSCPMELTVQEQTENGERKRKSRGDDGDGSTTPTLVSRASLSFEESDSETEESPRPAKRFRGQSKIVSVPQPTARTPTEPPKSKTQKETKNSPKKAQEKSEFLSSVPEDVVSHCLSFLGGAEDRSSLQKTCRLFRDISNSDEMLETVDLGGNKETGKGGILNDQDTPATASAKLAPFARAGNPEALYM